jgi:hypothetical protein
VVAAVDETALNVGVFLVIVTVLSAEALVPKSMGGPGVGV